MSKARIKIQPTFELPPPPPTEDVEVNTFPKEYSIEQAYPNPFNPNTTIRYQLPIDSRVTLKVYNTLGQVVTILSDEIQQAGFKSVTWNAEGVPSGVYFYRIVAGDFVETKKMVLMK